MTQGWIFWALLSAVFAAATTIFARIGVAGIDSDLATFIRTVVVLVLLAMIVAVRRKWTNPASLQPRTLLFLVLSALATGASWICYFRALQIGRASQVAPIDRLSLVLVAVFAFAFLGERPTGQDWLGILLVTAGVLALTLK
ncbi:MAG TPA: EamA family transporter [Steroidobacteraceae bacterium]|nr:EamA family transporter [Steroidobacteraceae bacterium]